MDNALKNDFKNNRLKTLRIERGLTQRELADSTGIKQANISRWEACVVIPNVNACWALADYFEVSLDYFCGRADK